MGNETIIKISNVEIKYRNNVILHNISLNINESEIIGFLGPSGSGKTTLIKSIIGMKEVSNGEIQVFNESIPNLNVVDKIGYMAQSDALYEDLSAIDNLIFFGELYGLKGKDARDRALDILALVELTDYAKTPVKKFSGGMKRRLSLAISLLHNPKLLILDEPTVGIDPLLRKKFWDEFSRLKSKGSTIIITTHVMDEAYKCDKLFFIRNGEIIAHGTSNEIMTSSNTNSIEDAFLYYSDKKEDK